MKNCEIKNNIKEFIKIIEEKYDNIFISYEYVSDIEGYEIWHNREDLEFEDIEFKRFTGKLLYDMFLSKGFYNLYISYDYEKSMNLLSMNSITSFEPGPIIQDYRIWDNRYDKIVFNQDSKNTENWLETSNNTTYSCENLPLHCKNISETNKIVVNKINLEKFDENLKTKNKNYELAA